jgi:hypothetical protein
LLQNIKQIEQNMTLTNLTKGQIGLLRGRYKVRRFHLLKVVSSHVTTRLTFTVPVKVKQSHYTPWTRKEERRYSSYSSTTPALDAESGQRHAPGKGPPVPIVQEAGWAPEPVSIQRVEDNSLASAGDRTPVVHPVVIH